MPNSFVYKDKTFTIGSTVNLAYKFKEGDKERKQIFKGIIIKVKGNSPQDKMITVRKISHFGIGVERIVPLLSPFLESISLLKKSSPNKANVSFIRNLTEQQTKTKLYRTRR